MVSGIHDFYGLLSGLRKNVYLCNHEASNIRSQQFFDERSGKAEGHNEYYPEVVAKLREAGHEVYDFRHPPSGDPGFKWSSVSEDYMEWSPQQYRDMLYHPKAERQFHNDIEAMEACDTFQYERKLKIGF